MNRIDRATDTRQQVTYLGRPVEFIEIPQIGKVWPRAISTAWATVLLNGIEVDLPLNLLMIEGAQR